MIESVRANGRARRAHEGSERKHGEGWGMAFQRFHMYWGGTFESLVTGGDSGTKSPQMATRRDEEPWNEEGCERMRNRGGGCHV